MKNVFQRSVNIDELKGQDISDYNPSELVAFLTTAYPNDPMGALRYLRETYTVGTRLGSQTELLLEGMKGVKTN